jgi:cyanophycinase-like exopeptidase
VSVVYSDDTPATRARHAAPALLGLGIGENTGLLIEDETRAKVIGTGTVIVVDGSAIEINRIGYVTSKTASS